MTRIWCGIRKKKNGCLRKNRGSDCQGYPWLRIGLGLLYIFISNIKKIIYFGILDNYILVDICGRQSFVLHRLSFIATRTIYMVPLLR